MTSLLETAGRRRRFFVLAVGLTCVGALYVLVGWVAAGAFGYPIDDPWIHETLARSLARHGELAINPGEPAAASTSLLWTALLVPGALLGLPPPFWAYALGAASLVLTAGATYRFAQALLPRSLILPPAAGLLALLDWHLVWAGFSGMETLLFTGLSVLLLAGAIGQPSRPAWQQGLLAGVLTLTRPEGLLLASIVGAWAFRGTPTERRWSRTSTYGLVLALCLLPLFTVNYLVSGHPLPATFTAKNAAYGAGVNPVAYAGYLWDAAIVLARGELLLLYPGLAYFLLRPARWASQRWLLPLVWAGLLLVAYMVWLPVLYHHGRYLFPLIPLIIVYGLAGSVDLLDRLPFRLLPRVVAVMLIIVALVSWVRGAQVYAGNVQYIYAQQVGLAQWARDSTPPDAVLATHDIGAFGYFAERKLVDIAGLASRELTSSPKDVERVLEVLHEKDVDFLFLLPSWYPPLTRALENSSFKKTAVNLPAKPTETVEGLEPFIVWRRMLE